MTCRCGCSRPAMSWRSAPSSDPGPSDWGRSRGFLLGWLYADRSTDLVLGFMVTRRDDRVGFRGTSVVMNTTRVLFARPHLTYL